MRHKPTKRWEMWKVEGETAKSVKETCPRCGSGVYMATHKETTGKIRRHCGKCHYTLWP